MGTGHATSKPLETFTFPLEMRKSAISDLGLRYWGLGAVGYLALFAIVITFASFDPFLTPPIPSYLLELSPRSSPAEAPNTRSATLAIPDWFRSTKQPIAPSRSTSIPESSASPNSDIVTSTHLEPIAGGRNRIRSSSSGRIGRQAVIEDLRSSIDGEFSVLSVKSEEASAGFSGNQSEDLMQRMDNFDGVTARTAGEQQLQTSQTGPISATVIGRSSRSVNVGKDVSSTTSQRLPTNANENLKITGVEGLNGQVVIEETMPEEMGDRPALVSRSSGDIMTVVRRNAGQLKNKYLQILKMNPNLNGELTLRITIESSGRVGNIELISDTTHNSGFVRTIMALIKGWRFGRTDGGQTSAKLTLPFSAN